MDGGGGVSFEAGEIGLLFGFGERPFGAKSVLNDATSGGENVFFGVWSEGGVRFFDEL